MWTAHRWNRIGRQRRASLLVPLVPLAVLVACSIDEILEVDIPGTVEEAALADTALAQTLVNGVIGDLECAWSNYVAAAAHHSDEWIPASGNLNMRNWGQRKITKDNTVMAQGDCGDNYGLYTPLHTARFQANDIYQRLEDFDPDTPEPETVPDKVDMQATVRAFGGFAMVALGEGFCGMAFDGGPLMTPAEVLDSAAAHFTEAINLATQTGNSDILNLALVGRARVRLNRGDFAGAIGDASQVPAGYLKVATRDDSEARRYNASFWYVNDPDVGHAFGRNASVADHYRDLTVDAQGNHTQASGTPDPRVNVTTDGTQCFDFATVHYYHDKYTSRGGPVPIASYKEAQLIVAEAAARSGDLATARQIINDRHALAGLPLWDQAGTATQDEVIAHVIDERARELFVEGGHRLNDMLRWQGTQFEIPFLGEPGSIHPNGVDQTGAEYGSVTCFPLPLVEEQGNPNIGG